MIKPSIWRPACLENLCNLLTSDPTRLGWHEPHICLYPILPHGFPIEDEDGQLSFQEFKDAVHNIGVLSAIAP